MILGKGMAANSKPFLFLSLCLAPRFFLVIVSVCWSTPTNQVTCQQRYEIVTHIQPSAIVIFFIHGCTLSFLLNVTYSQKNRHLCNLVLVEHLDGEPQTTKTQGRPCAVLYFFLCLSLHCLTKMFSLLIVGREFLCGISLVNQSNASVLTVTCLYIVIGHLCMQYFDLSKDLPLDECTLTPIKMQVCSKCFSYFSYANYTFYQRIQTESCYGAGMACKDMCSKGALQTFSLFAETFLDCVSCVRGPCTCFIYLSPDCKARFPTMLFPELMVAYSRLQALFVCTVSASVHSFLLTFSKMSRSSTNHFQSLFAVSCAFACLC